MKGCVYLLKDESKNVERKVNRLDPRKKIADKLNDVKDKEINSVEARNRDTGEKVQEKEDKNKGKGEDSPEVDKKNGKKKRLSFDNLKNAGVNTAKFAGKTVKDIGVNAADKTLEDLSDEYKAGKKVYKKVKNVKNKIKNIKKVGKLVTKGAGKVVGFIKWCVAAGPLGWLLLLFLFFLFLDMGEAIGKSDLEKFTNTTEMQQHENYGVVSGTSSELEERSQDPGTTDPITDEEKLLLLYHDCKGTDNGRDNIQGGHIFNEDYIVLQPFGFTPWATGGGAGLYAGTGVGHTGIDVVPIRKADFTTEDVKVYTVVEGTVMSVGHDAIGGNAVRVKMSNGKAAYYGHLKRATVSVGDKLKKGDSVGILGSTGATGGIIHVHFEVQDNPPSLATKDSSPYLGFDKVKQNQIIRVKDKPGDVSVSDKGDKADSEKETSRNATGKLPEPDPHLKPHVVEFRKFIYEQFGITDIGGYRSGPGSEDHGEGLALDVMVPKSSKLGDEVAQLAIDNMKEAGITYIIWKQRFYMGVNNIYGPANTWNPMADRGSITQNHYDHVHISFSRDGGTGRFKGKRESEAHGKCANVEDSNGRRLAGKNNEEKIWNFLMDEGFSSAAAAGLMGNMQQESNFKTDADNGTHHGIVQWGGSRRAALEAYAKSKGKDIDDLQSQLEFMIKEMRGMTFGGKPYREFIKLKDPGLVAKLFEEAFERSGGQNMDLRLKYADQIYNKYK